MPEINVWTASAWALLAAPLLDAWLGEPRRWHPLVGFGALTQWLERRMNSAPKGKRGGFQLRVLGTLAALILLAPAVLGAWWLEGFLLDRSHLIAFAGLGALTLYWAIGWKSLLTHMRAISKACQEKNLGAARVAVGQVVSRDCRSAQWPELRRAAIESGLENASDAVVGPLVWFLLAGIPGVILYRLSNTLDALWGYRSDRFQYFGWAAARWDDLLNLLPARVTALTFVLLAPRPPARGGGMSVALTAWRTLAHRCASPNAGPVMCAGAGALGVRLGGPAHYHGQTLDKPWFGGDREPDDRDLVRAMRLINGSLVLLFGLAGTSVLVWSYLL